VVIENFSKDEYNNLDKYLKVDITQHQALRVRALPYAVFFE
jgi:hypothetical protein